MVLRSASRATPCNRTAYRDVSTHAVLGPLMRRVRLQESGDWRTRAVIRGGHTSPCLDDKAREDQRRSTRFGRRLGSSLWRA